jgi:hypothetical protein
MLKQRLIDELKGEVYNPLPCLAVLAAASVREKPDLRASRPVVFIAEIIGGRGHVHRVGLAQDAEEVPALPAGRGPPDRGHGEAVERYPLDMAMPNRASGEPIPDRARVLVARYFGDGAEPRLELTEDPEAQHPEDRALEVVVIPTSLSPVEANARLDELLLAADDLGLVFDVAYT